MRDCTVCDGTGGFHRFGCTFLQPTSSLDAVEIHPQKMSGAPCIPGTRIPVAGILSALANGATLEELPAYYSGGVTLQQVRDALRWAAENLGDAGGYREAFCKAATLEEWITQQSDRGLLSIRGANSLTRGFDTSQPFEPWARTMRYNRLLQLHHIGRKTATEIAGLLRLAGHPLRDA